MQGAEKNPPATFAGVGNPRHWRALIVRRNGTSELGTVLRAWPAADGSIGLLIAPHADPNCRAIASDSEHWSAVAPQGTAERVPERLVADHTRTAS